MTTLKVFVATKLGQGMRGNDFYWCTEGELVYIAMRCDNGHVDDACGCRRSMSGMDSAKATSTFQLEQREMTREQYIGALRDSMQRSGWIDLAAEGGAEDESWITEQADEMLRLAAGFEPGDIVEVRGDDLRVRKLPQA